MRPECLPDFPTPPPKLRGGVRRGRLRTRVLPIDTVGFDDCVQGVGGDVDGNPVNTGVLLPSMPGVWYRVLLATADLNTGDSLIGYYQGLSLLAEIVTGEETSARTYIEERWIESNTWRYADGGGVWTITRDRLQAVTYAPGPLDQESFVFSDCDTCGLLYQTATIPPLDGSTKYPGYLGLTAYTPPGLQGSAVLVERGIREPMQRSRVKPLVVPVDAPTRFRFYVDVRQTNPSTRGTPTLGDDASTYAVTGLPPEESFQQLFLSTSRYGRAYGALIVKRR